MAQKRFRIREPFCGISHLIGAILAVIGLIVLLALAHGKPGLTLGFAIYGTSLILLYAASALYHSLPVSERHLEGLMRFDHSAIFLLIAGTYTPVCLILLRGALGRNL